MLKYEEKLHFDQHYKKMKEGSLCSKIIFAFWCISCYLGIYYLVRKYCTEIPDITSWKRAPVWQKFYGVACTYADVIFLILGLILMWYGSVKLIKITEENHSARDRKADRPTKLITQGCYAKSRHPMYGIFVVMYSSIFIAFHSVIGIAVMVIMFLLEVFNALSEEQRTLIPAFGEEYLAYMKKVKCLIFTRAQTMMFIAVIIVTIIGLLF